MLGWCALLNDSFEDPKLPKKYRYGTANDIEAPLIAQKFESISGQKIYGTVAWREWCTLERTLGDETMTWLGEVCTCLVFFCVQCVPCDW